MIATRISGSSRTMPHSSPSSRRDVSFVAFSRSGRLNVIVAMWSDTSNRIVSKSMRTPPHGDTVATSGRNTVASFVLSFRVAGSGHPLTARHGHQLPDDVPSGVRAEEGGD